MDDDGHVAGPEVLGVRARLRRLVALRVGQEDLHPVGVHLRGARQGSAVQQGAVVGQPWADVYADRVWHGVRP